MPGSPPARREAVIRHRLGRFCADQGIEVALCPDVTEAFVVLGLPGRAPSTKGTYRSVLRSLAGLDRPVVATSFSGSPAQAPYSRQERGELWALAAAQRSAWRRRSALVLLVLGIGAGLRAGELAATTVEDLSTGRAGVAVRAGGARGRLVPVQGQYATALTELAKDIGAGYLFCPGQADRAYRNFVNNFCYSLETDPAAPRLSSGRARSSFICDHLAAGTPLRELLYLAGIAEVESLLRYARHVPGAPSSKAELRKRSRGT